MKKIKLNETAAELSFDSEYILNPTEKICYKRKKRIGIPNGNNAEFSNYGTCTCT